MVNAVKISNWLRVNNYMYYHPQILPLPMATQTKPIDGLPFKKMVHFLYCIQGLALALYNQKAFSDRIYKSFKDVYVFNLNKRYKYGFDNILVDIYNLNFAMNQNINRDDINDYQQIEQDHKLTRIVHAVVNQYANYYEEVFNGHGYIDATDIKPLTSDMEPRSLTYEVEQSKPVQNTKLFHVVSLKALQSEFKTKVDHYEFHHVLYPYQNIFR